MSVILQSINMKYLMGDVDAVLYIIATFYILNKSAAYILF